MTIPAPLALYEAEVRPEWIDYNGHMNVAYYVLAFDLATDALFDFAGVGKSYTEARGHSVFAVEAHVTYRRELCGGEAIRVTTQFLGFDDKRMHFVHHMVHAAGGWCAATSEWLGLHVDMGARRAAPFPGDVAARLGAIREAHASLPVPPEVGRVIRLAHQAATRFF